MKRLHIFLVSLLAFLSCHTLMAQEIEAPDYRQIRLATTNIKSNNYYPRLFVQYQHNDTTLSLEQVRYLYYGFAIQEDFVPYQTEKSTLWAIRNQMVQTGGSKEVCPEAIRIAKEMLDDNPFDLPAIATISLAYLQLGDTAQYRLWNEKQTNILDAITSSGDGETEETAIHVINIEHEYEVCARMGLEVIADSLCNNEVEFLKVKPNAEDIPGLYFNFGACVNAWKKRWE